MNGEESKQNGEVGKDCPFHGFGTDAIHAGQV